MERGSDGGGFDASARLQAAQSATGAKSVNARRRAAAAVVDVGADADVQLVGHGVVEADPDDATACTAPGPLNTPLIEFCASGRPAPKFVALASADARRHDKGVNRPIS